jgi:hypothetical protein
MHRHERHVRYEMPKFNDYKAVAVSMVSMRRLGQPSLLITKLALYH